MSEAELIQVQPDELKKQGYAMIRGMPCRLSEVNNLPKVCAATALHLLPRVLP